MTDEQISLLAEVAWLAWRVSDNDPQKRSWKQLDRRWRERWQCAVRAVIAELKTSDLRAERPKDTPGK